MIPNNPPTHNPATKVLNLLSGKRAERLMSNYDENTCLQVSFLCFSSVKRGILLGCYAKADEAPVNRRDQAPLSAGQACQQAVQRPCTAFPNPAPFKPQMCSRLYPGEKPEKQKTHKVTFK